MTKPLSNAAVTCVHRARNAVDHAVANFFATVGPHVLTGDLAPGAEAFIVSSAVRAALLALGLRSPP